MTLEQWRQVDGFQYEVSNLGRARSQYRMVRYRHGFRPVYPRLLKPGTSSGGYQMVILSRNSKTKSFRVHTLVLEAFVGRKPVGMGCRHLDGNPLNNKLSNLCWGTKSENARDAVKHGTIPHPNSAHKGESHGRAKLTNGQVKEIRRRSGADTVSTLAKEFDVSSATISRIIKRKAWRHI